MGNAAGEATGRGISESNGRDDEDAAAAAALGSSPTLSRSFGSVVARHAIAASPQAALSAAEAGLDAALVHIDADTWLLDGLVELAESYFEAIVASRSPGAAADALREAAREHALLAQTVIAGQMPSAGFVISGAVPGSSGGCPAGAAACRLVEALVGPLVASDRNDGAAAGRADEAIAFAVYGLTQARIGLAAQQHRIAALSEAVRRERRGLETVATGEEQATLATLAQALRAGLEPAPARVPAARAADIDAAAGIADGPLRA